MLEDPFSNHPFRYALQPFAKIGVDPPTTEQEAALCDAMGVLARDARTAGFTIEQTIVAVKSAAMDIGFSIWPAEHLVVTSWRNDLLFRLIGHCIDRYYADCV